MKKVVLILIIAIACKSSIKSRKENLQLQIKEADSLYKSEDFSHAYLLYNEILKVDSLKGEFYFRRGVSAAQTGRRMEALLDFGKCAGENYRKSEAYFNAGLIFLYISDKDAIVYFGYALRKDSTNEKAKNLLAEAKKRIAEKK